MDCFTGKDRKRFHFMRLFFMKIKSDSREEAKQETIVYKTSFHLHERWIKHETRNNSVAESL